MKIFILPLAVMLALTLACNNTNKETKTDDKKAVADSLWEQVMEGHDVGMAKMSQLERAQNEAHRLIDSIGRLPANLKNAAEPYKVKLDSLVKRLSYAVLAMNKWMEEMNWEAKKLEVEARINYLKDEKLKVDKMKSAILNSLSEADTLLKKKF